MVVQISLNCVRKCMWKAGASVFILIATHFRVYKYLKICVYVYACVCTYLGIGMCYRACVEVGEQLVQFIGLYHVGSWD